MTHQTTFRPQQVHETVFIAQGAVIVGDVTLDENASVWFNAVLRGDTEKIIVGAGTNIQDGAVLHADPGYPTIIGAGCTVGHGAIVHGAQVGDNTLVGMGAILLNGVVVGASCIIGAGALLTQGRVFAAGSLILGNPAKVIREATNDEITGNRTAAGGYIQKARAFKRA